MKGRVPRGSRPPKKEGKSSKNNEKERGGLNIYTQKEKRERGPVQQ